MTEFSANLGFLWAELSLPEAIRAAAKAGFDAVECHFPYETSTEQVNAALKDTGLKMIGLNTVKGDKRGDNGLAAIPGREEEARAAIDQSVAYAHAIKAANIHVMAGFASGDAAHKTFVGNLRYATNSASIYGITILIEPLNHYDAPDYFLQNTSQAAAIIKEVGANNLKLMFDCYHVQIMEGDVSRRLADLQPLIGHIQIASVPERSEPDEGELDYRHILKVLDDIAYNAPVGAEYKPTYATEDGLGWMDEMR